VITRVHHVLLSGRWAPSARQEITTGRPEDNAARPDQHTTPHQDLRGRPRHNRRVVIRHRHRRGAAAVHRHRWPGRERAGRGSPHLCRRDGHTLVDRELHLRECWISDPGRCAAAGIPASAEFATKPELARRMNNRALDGGTPAGWVTGDEVYGADPRLRAGPEKRQVSYVLAVAKNHRVAHAAGAVRADTLAQKLPPRAWQRLPGRARCQGPPLV
jgi:DDE superfamily endonuclease